MLLSSRAACCALSVVRCPLYVVRCLLYAAALVSTRRLQVLALGLSAALLAVRLLVDSAVTASDRDDKMSEIGVPLSALRASVRSYDSFCRVPPLSLSRRERERAQSAFGLGERVRLCGFRGPSVVRACVLSNDCVHACMHACEWAVRGEPIPARRPLYGHSHRRIRR